MIDVTLLRQLGWSNELIDEVTRVAEPIRQTSKMMDIGSSITILNYAVGNSICVDPYMNSSSQSIKIMPS